MPNTPEMWLQQGFRLALGCAGTLVEWVQDEQKRQTQLQQWQAGMQQLVQELVAKGEKTEAEAREFVERLFQRTSPSSAPPPPVDVEVTSAPADAATQLQELTQELSALRESLEQSRPGE
jgi:polyhydroxyalkanoate synthesis regulator phasin